MNQAENRFYQDLARKVRWRYRHGGPDEWPGKILAAPAESLYPNILAELEARLYPNLDLFAEFAKVSPEIMAAVVEDGESLTWTELRGLSYSIDRSPDYLASDTLAMIDPATKKGKRRLWELETLLLGLGKFGFRWRCERIRTELTRGEPVTYAAWRRACEEAKTKREPTEKSVRRTARLVS